MSEKAQHQHQQALLIDQLKQQSFHLMLDQSASLQLVMSQPIIEDQARRAGGVRAHPPLAIGGGAHLTRDEAGGERLIGDRRRW